MNFLSTKVLEAPNIILVEDMFKLIKGKNLTDSWASRAYVCKNIDPFSKKHATALLKESRLFNPKMPNDFDMYLGPLATCSDFLFKHKYFTFIL